MSGDGVFGRDLHLGIFADESGRYVAGPTTHGDLVATRADRGGRSGVDLGLVQRKANMAQTIIKDGFLKVEDVYRNVPRDQWPKTDSK